MKASTETLRAPFVPGSQWLLGHLPDLRRDALGLMRRAGELGPVTGLRLGPRGSGYLVSHPDGIKRILLDAVDMYSKRTRGFDTLRIFLGNGLLTSEGDFWRRQRRIAQPAFHHREITRFAETMVSAAAQHANGWAMRGHAPFDMFDDMMQLTLQVVGECLFSTDPTDRKSEIGPAITVLIRKFARRATQPIAFPVSWPMPGHAEIREALTTLHGVVDEMIAERRRGGPRARRDLLDMLMATEDADTGERMNDRQVRDEVFTLLVAGHETTASTLAWTFCLLAEHPDVDDRLEREIDKLDGGAPRTADLESLPFVGQVVREALRLYPPAWLLARRAERADVICGVDVPKGSVVYISPYVTHRRPDVFPRPDNFEPDRFQPDGGPTGGFSKYAFLPFGGGPRICIGHGFAMMEAQLLLTVLRQSYRLALAPGAKPRPSPQMTLRARKGIWMTATPRR